MPDVAPLSRGRKMMTLVVLLGLFGASLGAAEAVMMYGKRRQIANTWIVNYSLDPKLGFKLVESNGTVDVYESADGHRKAEIYRQEIPFGDDAAPLEEVAAQEFSSMTGRSPPAVVAAPWHGFQGVEIREYRAVKHDFTIVRVLLIGRNITEVIYSGTSRFIDSKDEQTYQGLLNGLKPQPAK
jgi:hypothetical protein